MWIPLGIESNVNLTDPTNIGTPGIYRNRIMPGRTKRPVAKPCSCHRRVYKYHRRACTDIHSCRESEASEDKSSSGNVMR